MDPVDNPYTPGAGTPPPILTGRDRELAQVNRLLRRLARGRPDRSIIISGLRGVGKTVLLTEVELLAREAGWATSKVVEIRPGTDDRATLARMSANVLRDLSSVRAVAREARRRAMRVLGSFAATATSDGSIQLRVDTTPERGIADSGDIELDVSDLFEELGQLALNGGTGVLFLVDEMQHLSDSALEALCAALHRVAQRELPVAVIGAGLPQLPRLLATAKSYAERQFAYMSIGNLDEAAARQALVAPAAKLGVAFEAVAVDYIVSRTDCYPYFLQEYGSEVWDLAPSSPITLEVAEHGHAAAREALDEGFFRARFEKGEPAERRYMQAMASLGGSGPYPQDDVSRALGGRLRSGAGTQLDGLIAKGLVFKPADRWVDFTVPQFADFLARKHPH